MQELRLRGVCKGKPRVRAAFEALEERRLLSMALYADTPAESWTPQPQIASARLSALQPSITGSRPANNEVNVPRYTFIALDVMLVNVGHGIDPATANTDNVKLNRTSDNQFVNANITIDGAGGAITIQPTAMLAANTQYTVAVTSGLKDTSGASFAPFTMRFTTGTQVPAQDGNIVFSKTTQASSTGRRYSSLAWGPDNKLYAGTLDGQILRFSVGSGGTLGSPEVFTTVNTNNGENRFIIGMEFDPASTAGNLILWVSHAQGVLEDADDWTGKISRLSGPNLATYQDYVVNLPRSVRDHLTNQIHFGDDGAIYFSQPSMNAMGAPDTAWVRADHPLSGTVLRVDLSKITSAPVDVRTSDGGGSYNPSSPNAPVTIYATGVRNGYDFVFHSNGHLYMPANGSAAGGDTPAGPGGNPPAVVGVPYTMHDYVFDVLPGKYYGQPNTTRGEYILNGGNPTAGVDRNEVLSYPVGTQPDADYNYDAFDFGQNYAPTGIIEYKSNTFGGALRGRMLVTRYSGGDDVFILTPSPTGNSLGGINGVGMDGFNDPTDIIEDPNTGNLYVAQLGTENSGQPRNLT